MADAPAGAPRERATPGNVFTNKIGPLPMWAWVAIIGAAILGYAYFKNRSSGSSTAASSSTPASDVPEFVNQTYTTVTAPAAPTPNAGGGATTGTPAPTGGGGGGPVNVAPPPGVGKPGEGTVPPAKPPVKPTAKPPAKKPGKVTEPIFNAKYTVKPGDTLASVAKRYKITREQLAHANGYGTGAGLRTGEVLKVPSPAGTGTPNKAP